MHFSILSSVLSGVDTFLYEGRHLSGAVWHLVSTRYLRARTLGRRLAPKLQLHPLRHEDERGPHTQLQTDTPIQSDAPRRDRVLAI